MVGWSSVPYLGTGRLISRSWEALQAPDKNGGHDRIEKQIARPLMGRRESGRLVLRGGSDLRAGLLRVEDGRARLGHAVLRLVLSAVSFQAEDGEGVLRH